MLRPLAFPLSSLLVGATLAHDMPAMAQTPTLTVYTYESFVPEWGPGPKIEAAFEAGCGCDLVFVGLGDGVGILNRLRLEGERTEADVALGITTDLIPEMLATGLFAPSNVDVAALDIPGGFADEIFVPFDYSYLAFIYDSEVVTDPPTSLAALVAGSPEVKIAIPDARTSTPGLGLLLWMKAVYGEDAGAQWAALSDRILTVTPGWSEGYGLFTSGEVPIVLSYTTSPAYHLIEENEDRYRAAAFDEGHYIQIEVAGRLAGSDQPELARQFLAFLISQEAQAILPTTNWTLPVVALDAPLPAAFGSLVQPSRALSIPPAEVATNRAAWTQEWLEGLGR